MSNSRLTQEFLDVAVQVRTKMDEAAKLLREATALAKAAGLPTITKRSSDYGDELEYNKVLTKETLEEYDIPLDDTAKEVGTYDYDLDYIIFDEIDSVELNSALRAAGWSTSAHRC